MTELHSAAQKALRAMRDAAYDEEGYVLNPDLAEAHDKLRAALAKAQGDNNANG